MCNYIIWYSIYSAIRFDRSLAGSVVPPLWCKVWFFFLLHFPLWAFVMPFQPTNLRPFAAIRQKQPLSPDSTVGLLLISATWGKSVPLLVSASRCEGTRVREIQTSRTQASEHFYTSFPFENNISIASKLLPLCNNITEI